MRCHALWNLDPVPNDTQHRTHVLHTFLCAHRIADKHVKTLVKCLGHYGDDPHVRLFRRFLNKEYDTDDLKFYLIVVMLSRDGIPTSFTKYGRVWLFCFVRDVVTPVPVLAVAPRTIKTTLMEDEAFMRLTPAEVAAGAANNGSSSARSAGGLKARPSLYDLRQAHPEPLGMAVNTKQLRSTPSMRVALPVKQVAAARLIPRRAAHADHGLPRGVPLPDWFWASVTASTLARVRGEPPPEMNAPEGTAAGYRDLISATSRASYIRLAEQCVGTYVCICVVCMYVCGVGQVRIGM